MSDNIVAIYLYQHVAYEFLEWKQKWISWSFNVDCLFIHLRLFCWYKGMISMCFALSRLFSIKLIPVTTEIVQLISVRELSLICSPKLFSLASHFMFSVKRKTCFKERWKRTTEKVCFIKPRIGDLCIYKLDTQ